MAATVQASRSAPPNHRRWVRHRVHAPAYATFSGASQSEMLDLYEILDISEAGVAVQCASPLPLNQQVELCLDLAEATGQIWVTGQVIWSDSAGRAGFRLLTLTEANLRCLQQWLFLNAMAAAANAAAFGVVPLKPAPDAELRPNYTDILTAAAAVQREAESLETDLVAVLSLVAARSQSLLRASGAAIALVEEDVNTMICRASVGQCAPPEGATLKIGSGFSGECVRTRTLLRCDDAETDPRVDLQSCRALGIRSILAAPIHSGEKTVGLLEVFSPRARAFGENESAVLQRFAETILAALHRAIQATSQEPPAVPAQPFSSQGSILFASEISRQKTEANDSDQGRDRDKQNRDQQNKDKKDEGDTQKSKDATASAHPNHTAGVRLPRAYLYLLVATAATIFMVLGFVLAPWIQPWVQSEVQDRLQNAFQKHRPDNPTVLASSQTPADASKFSSADSASPAQLRQLAGQGDPAAENALGLLYAQGDELHGVKPDESEAARWFLKAAEQNYVPAQSKLGALYWGGRGVPANLNQAYFWTVLARAAGDPGSKTLAPVLASHMTRAQAATIEQQAEIWYQQHESNPKARPDH